MKKIIKYAMIAVIAIFAGIQLVPVDRSNPPVVSDLEAPLEVKRILQRSCYDCHSNEVNWPWYSYVAPVSWLVSYDVKEGREQLNFSEWNKYASDGEMKEEIIEEISEGEMPLPIYLITHQNASVSQQELSTLRQWAGSAVGTHKAHHDD
jgi:hypothetical protein